MVTGKVKGERKSGWGGELRLLTPQHIGTFFCLAQLLACEFFLFVNYSVFAL